MAPSSQRPGRSFTSRTSLLTAAAVVGVLLAGGAAIAANIGILDAADNSAIGELSATDDLIQATVPTAPPTSIAPIEAFVAVPTAITGVSSEYTVDDAGSVTLVTDAGVLALDRALPTAGWIHAATQDSPTSLTVTFTDGTRTVIFTASLEADGSITADVVEPIQVPGTTVAGASPPSALPATSPTDYDDDHEDDDHDDVDHEDDDPDDGDDEDHDEDHDDDHEDEHEYEGRDDDD